MAKKSNLVGPDPSQVLREATSAIAIRATTDVEQHSQKLEYAGSTPHYDENLSPSEVLNQCLKPWQRFIWNLFETFVLDDMEAALIRSREWEEDTNKTPLLLGTMLIKMKDGENQFYYVRFIEKPGKQGYRSVEIVENPIVTEGSVKQHEYISNQIRGMTWYVGYADPWEKNLITTQEMLQGMRNQKGFAIANNSIQRC